MQAPGGSLLGAASHGAGVSGLERSLRKYRSRDCSRQMAQHARQLGKGHLRIRTLMSVLIRVEKEKWKMTWMKILRWEGPEQVVLGRLNFIMTVVGSHQNIL